MRFRFSWFVPRHGNQQTQAMIERWPEAKQSLRQRLKLEAVDAWAEMAHT